MLLICAAFNNPALAETVAEYEKAWDGNNYISVIVKLKPNKNRAIDSTPPELNTHELTVSPLFTAPTLKGAEAAELAELDERYGFNRYLRVELPENRQHDTRYINELIGKLAAQDSVELVYPESVPVSLDRGLENASRPQTSGMSFAQNGSPKASVPDFRAIKVPAPSGFTLFTEDFS